MLEIQNLCAAYPGKPVLQGISLSVPTGQVTVLLGPNGCGKSTLLKTICGILPATSGQILLDGQNLLQLHPKKLAQTVAYLAQNRQIPDITVERLVLHGRFPYLSYPRRYRPQDYAASHAAMAQLGLLELAHIPMSQLSGGQQQKVYIAMALAQDTPIILLDEPTTYLDISHQLQLLAQAKALSRQGKTVVMVVHDIPAAMAVADHIVLMEQGRTAFQGNSDALFDAQEIDRVFEVRLQRVQTPTGWQYYCQER